MTPEENVILAALKRLGRKEFLAKVMENLCVDQIDTCNHGCGDCPLGWGNRSLLSHQATFSRLLRLAYGTKNTDSNQPITVHNVSIGQPFDVCGEDEEGKLVAIDSTDKTAPFLILFPNGEKKWVAIEEVDYPEL